MLMELLAAIVSGFAAAGVVLLLRRFVSGRIPGWATPAAAGLGMIGFAIWSEYTWFERSTASLPPGVMVIESIGQRSPFRPWTFIWPLVTEFTAIDAAGLRRNPARENAVLVTSYNLARHAPVIRQVQIVDCGDGMRAVLSGAEAFDQDGLPQDAEWQPVEADNRLFRVVCRGRMPVAEG